MNYYPLEKESAVPLYVQLADIIKKNIDEGHLPPKTPLPSESQLMKKYDVSRITVRNALLRLEYSGDVFKVHGKGSFVSVKRITDYVSPSSSWRNLIEKKGHNVSYKLVEFTEVLPSDGVLRELQLPRREKVRKIKRIKKLNQENIGLDLFFMPMDLCSNLNEKHVMDSSIIDFLNTSPETRINRIEAQIRSAAIESGDAETLGVDYSSTVLIRGFVAYNESDKPVLCGKVVYLSQYAVINIKINTEHYKANNSFFEAPGIDFGNKMESDVNAILD